MPALATMPIRRQLTLIILITCSVVLLLSCVALAIYELLDFRRAAVRDAMVVADILGENTQAALTFDDAEAARKVLGALQAEPHVIAARVFTAKGRAFADYTRPGAPAVVPSAADEPGHRFAGGALHVYRAIEFDGKRIGTIYVASDLDGIYDRLALFAGMSGLVLVSSLGLAFFISSRLQRPISEPILALAATAKAVAEHKDYSVRATARGGAEFAMLTGAFNHMLAQIARHADDLAATNAELEQFAYIASHDLKEPLRMVTQYMGILDRQLGGQLTPQHRQFLGHAVDGAKRMQTLINDLLAFTKTSHVQEPRLDVVLGQVVGEILATFQERIAETKAVVEVGPMPTIPGERAKLALVFQNLLGNALKFHAADRAPRVAIVARRDRDDWVISVADNGIGIEPIYHQQIFAVFQRLHRRDEFPGNGMGLAICRKIVEQHRGQLTVESALGAGSTFFIRIPATQATPQRGAPTVAENRSPMQGSRP